MKSLLFAI